MWRQIFTKINLKKIAGLGIIGGISMGFMHTVVQTMEPTKQSNLMLELEQLLPETATHLETLLDFFGLYKQTEYIKLTRQLLVFFSKLALIENMLETGELSSTSKVMYDAQQTHFFADRVIQGMQAKVKHQFTQDILSELKEQLTDCVTNIRHSAEIQKFKNL